MTDVHTLVVKERLLMADLFDSLDAEQWNAQSLCGTWNVRDVAAHLVMPFEVGIPKFLLLMVKNAFDFNKLNHRFARNDTRSGSELASVLRDNADHPFTPPGFGDEAPLTDAYVHGQDIRRPLGLSRTTDPEIATTVLRLLVTTKGAKAFGGKGLIDGLQIEAADIDWKHGSGPVARGNAEALIMSLSGRTVAIDDLEGDGVTTLRSRSLSK